jgi:signal transduction histidine kinase
MRLTAELRHAAARVRDDAAARIGRLPVRVRLTLSFGVVMVVLFGLIALLLYFSFSAGLDTEISSSLSSRADQLKLIVATQHGPIRPGNPALASQGGDFARIVDGRGTVLDSSGGGSPSDLLTRAQLRAAEHGRVLVSVGQGQRLLAEPLAAPHGGVLVVGISLAQRNGALNTLGDLLFVGGPIALLLACAAGYLLAERVLAPVERMRRRAEGISGKRSGARLPVPDTRDELQSLGETLNEMLARLDAALGRERVLVALASHELRTPLSIIKLELELALDPDRSRGELEDALRSVIEEVDRLTLLAHDMLTVARADEGGLPLDRQPIEASDLLHSTAERVARATGRSRDDLIVEAEEGLVVEADRERLERALANMADNALRHGGEPVVLRAVANNGDIELHVSDSGPGFPPAFLPHAFERFSRADPAHPSTGGTGLGLAIVRAVAEAHGGSADAENNPGGGAHVWVRLPLAAKVRATSERAV